MKQLTKTSALIPVEYLVKVLTVINRVKFAITIHLRVEYRIKDHLQSVIGIQIFVTLPI